MQFFVLSYIQRVYTSLVVRCMCRFDRWCSRVMPQITCDFFSLRGLWSGSFSVPRTAEQTQPQRSVEGTACELFLGGDCNFPSWFRKFRRSEKPGFWLHGALFWSGEFGLLSLGFTWPVVDEMSMWWTTRPWTIILKPWWTSSMLKWIAQGQGKKPKRSWNHEGPWVWLGSAELLGITVSRYHLGRPLLSWWVAEMSHPIFK